MGYGLVAIPRTMWREADVRSRQRLLCHQAGAQAKKALHAHHELTTVPCRPPAACGTRLQSACLAMYYSSRATVGAPSHSKP